MHSLLYCLQILNKINTYIHILWLSMNGYTMWFSGMSINLCIEGFTHLPWRWFLLGAQWEFSTQLKTRQHIKIKIVSLQKSKASKRPSEHETNYIYYVSWIKLCSLQQIAEKKYFVKFRCICNNRSIQFSSRRNHPYGSEQGSLNFVSVLVLGFTEFS